MVLKSLSYCRALLLIIEMTIYFNCKPEINEKLKFESCKKIYLDTLNFEIITQEIENFPHHSIHDELKKELYSENIYSSIAQLHQILSSLQPEDWIKLNNLSLIFKNFLAEPAKWKKKG